MDRLHSPSEKSFNQIDHVAIAIKAVSAEQRHTGLLHRDAKRGEIHLLHLSWHHNLKQNQPDGSYFWVETKLPALRAEQVAAACRMIWRSNGKFIPYGFSLPTDNFDLKTAEFLVGKSNLGLTCATFVLAIFEFARIRLVDYATWPTRPDDEIWKNHILDLLSQGDKPAPLAHIESVRSQMSCARFRPEEVAAAAVLFPPTGSFESVEELSKQFVKHLLVPSK